MGRIHILMEIQRYFDSRVLQEELTYPSVLDLQETEILQWGMNLSTSLLLCSLPAQGGVPMAAVCEQGRRSAGALLYRFGVVALLRRAAEMARVGMLTVEIDGSTWRIREVGRFIHQFMDQLEPSKFARQMAIRETSDVTPEGWSMIDHEHATEGFDSRGAFIFRSPASNRSKLGADEIREIMNALARPWKTQFGTFLSYGADERLDAEFMMVAQERIRLAIEDAGIHPSVKFKGFSAQELIAVCLALRMFNEKHLAHCRVALESMPEIDAWTSLTLWQKKAELVESLIDMTGLDCQKIELILKYISIGPGDVGRLGEEPVSLLPMIIDFENGMLLRPISSTYRNQFVSFLSISRWRDKNSINVVSNAREGWFRENLYALFRGNRYMCVSGNVVLRRGGRRVTDLDAVILDRVTGELAIFQLKWQDYFSSDVKQLGSRAKNFSEEVDGWAEAVSGWIREASAFDLLQTLRLDPKRSGAPQKIFLFALSWRVARSAGYGYPVLSPFLSVASWPQFCRVRMEVGPKDSIFDSLHRALREEEDLSPREFTPAPYALKLSGGECLIFENLWYERPRDPEAVVTEPGKAY